MEKKERFPLEMAEVPCIRAGDLRLRVFDLNVLTIDADGELSVWGDSSDNKCAILLSREGKCLDAAVGAYGAARINEDGSLFFCNFGKTRLIQSGMAGYLPNESGFPGLLKESFSVGSLNRGEALTFRQVAMHAGGLAALCDCGEEKGVIRLWDRVGQKKDMFPGAKNIAKIWCDFTISIDSEFYTYGIDAKGNLFGWKAEPLGCMPPGGYDFTFADPSEGIKADGTCRFKIEPVPLPALSGITGFAHSANGEICIAANADGEAYAWRDDERRLIPLLLDGKQPRNISAVSLQSSHAYLLGGDGVVYEWEYDESERNMRVYEGLRGARVIALGSGCGFTAALDDRGKIHQWGREAALQFLNLIPVPAKYCP